MKSASRTAANYVLAFIVFALFQWVSKAAALAVTALLLLNQTDTILMSLKKKP